MKQALMSVRGTLWYSRIQAQDMMIHAWHWLKRTPCLARDIDGNPCRKVGVTRLVVGSSDHHDYITLCGHHLDMMAIERHITFRDGSELTLAR